MAPRASPVARLVVVTETPRRGNLDGSETVPVRSADELRACDKAGKAPKTRALSRHKTFTACLSILPPKCNPPDKRRRLSLDKRCRLPLCNCFSPPYLQKADTAHVRFIGGQC